MKAISDFRGIDRQLKSLLTRLCNKRVAHREFMHRQLPGEEQSSQADAMWIDILELAENYKRTQKRLERMAMSIADHKFFVAESVDLLRRTLEEALKGKLRSLVPWKTQEFLNSLAEEVLLEDLKKRNVL